MALFATRAIRAGDELTHSYLPLAVLARPAAHRQPHLHFACSCARCKAEAEEAEVEEARAKETVAAVAAEEHLAFHVSCAAGDWANAISEGEAVLRQARPLLASSPHAALDFTHAYLGAHWALHAAGEGGGAAPVHARAAAKLHAEVAAALCDAAGEAAPHRRRSKAPETPLLTRVAGSGLPSWAILWGLEESSRSRCRRGPRGGAPMPAHKSQTSPPLLVLKAQSAARATAPPRGGAGGGAGRAHVRRGTTRPCPRAPCRVTGRLARLAPRRPADVASGGGGAADSGGAARAGARRPGCGLGTGQVVIN